MMPLDYPLWLQAAHFFDFFSVPARYISTSASSTELSGRRYRSRVAVSNGNVRSFGTFKVPSPVFV
jgi:hypothetical protein